ncbi:MAG: cation transporter [Sphingobacterium sp.]|jgi:divalent metal cation (Fe/Co/Zn/Cd) transporter|nr:cation transporter [Sphingobacterium sp.]
MKDKQSVIESKAMLMGGMVYLTLGVAAWIVYSLSNSEAILLEGNYNIVNALASFIGFYVVSIKNRSTTTFPLGQFIYEALYSLVKGVLILGILTAALWENGFKIIKFLTRGETHEINTGPIGGLVILSVFLSFGLVRYYKWQNQKIGNRSSMLVTDTKGAIIDGYLSLFAGGSLLLMIYIGRIFPAVSFLQYIGDALVVLIFEIIMIKEPIHIIRQNFVELTGGQMQSEKERRRIIEIVELMPREGFEIQEIYISKTGSLILVLLYISGKDIDPEQINEIYRPILQKELCQVYAHANVEILI